MPNNNNNKAKLRVSESYLVDITIPGWAQDPGLQIRTTEEVDRSFIVELAELRLADYVTELSHYWDIVVTYRFPTAEDKAQLMPELIAFWEQVIKELEPPEITDKPARQEWNARKQKWLEKLGPRWRFSCPDEADEE